MGLVARIMEQRTHPANLERWLLRAFKGTETKAGVQVDHETALTSSAVLDGVRMISQDVARVPLNLYRRLKPRGKEVAEDQPLHDLLHTEPNEEQTSLELREMVTASAVLCGTGFIEIVTGRGGDVLAFWPIPAHRVTPKRLSSGALVWLVAYPNEPLPRPVPLGRIFPIRGFATGGVLGVDVVGKMREAIGLTLATEQFGAAFFGNGSNPGGAIEVPELLTDEAYAHLQKSWEEKHRGPDNAHRVAILEEGAKWVQMGIPPEAAQFLETRKFQVTEIARALGMPPHKLRDHERATFSNIEHEAINYVTGTLGPWYNRWEQSLRKWVLTPTERRQFFIEHVIEGLLRGDIKTRYEAYAVARANGWASVNDVREKENENPIPADMGGDDYHVPVNMVRLQDLAALALMPSEDTPPADDPDDDERSERRAELRQVQQRSITGRRRQRVVWERVFLGTAERAVGREVGALRTALKKAFGARDSAAFRTEVDAFYERHEKYLRDAFLPLFRSFAEVVHGEVAQELGGATAFPVALEQFARDYAETFAKRYTGQQLATIRGMLKNIAAEEIEAALEERIADWEAGRAPQVARRETQQSMNAFSFAAYAAATVVYLRVVATGENCPLCREIDGRRYRIGSPALAEGETLDPKDGVTQPLTAERDFKHPPFHDGCDCTVVAD